MSTFEKTKHNKCWQGDGRTQHPCCYWEHKRVKPLWKRVWQCKKGRLHFWCLILDSFQVLLFTFCPTFWANQWESLLAPFFGVLKEFKLCHWRPSLQPHLLDAIKAKVTYLVSLQIELEPFFLGEHFVHCLSNKLFFISVGTYVSFTPTAE